MAKTFVFVGLPEVCNELAPNLLEAGFKAAGGVAEADVVFTFTPFIEDTEDVYFGSDGIVESAKAGAIFVNLAPASPSLQYEIYALARISNMTAVDAPLYVHDPAREHAYADPSNLTAFIGANDDDYAQVSGMVDALCADVVICGQGGAGQLSKAASTLLRAGSIVGLAEANALASAAQGDSADAAGRVCSQALAHGAVNEDAAAIFSMVAARNFTGSYSSGVLLGEVVSALSCADDSDLILPQAEAAEYLLQLLYTIGGSGKALSAISLLYASEDECEVEGIDWSRADEFYDFYDQEYGYDDYDGYDDSYGPDDSGHGSGGGHGHRHGPGGGFGFPGYSPN